MGKMGTGVEAGFPRLCNTSGQDPRQEWRRRLQRGKHTPGRAWHRPTPRYTAWEMAADLCPEVRVLDRNYFQLSQVFRKHAQKASDNVPSDPAGVCPHSQ